MNSEEQLASDLSSYAADPLGCVLYSFPWREGPLADFHGPYDWQRDILDTMGKHLRSPFWNQPLQIAVASGHGIGKTALIGMISHWAVSTMADARVMMTANTKDQLDTKTWPEVRKWFSRSVNAHWWDAQATRITSKQKGHETSWRVDRETWSEENTEAFQGLHNLHRRIVVIFDEGSAIPKAIWDVVLGALTDENTELIFIVFGNPTEPAGEFAKCFGAQKHRWVTRQIDSRTVPGTNKALFERWRQDFGEDSDFFRVRVRGEFPRAGSRNLIPQDVVFRARQRRCTPAGYKVLAVDVARFGSNQTVILGRQGLVAEVFDRVRGADTTETARRLIHRILTWEPRCCIIDGDGIGGGVADQVRAELPKLNQPRREWPDTALARWFATHPWFTVQEFHGASPPADPFMYFNRRAEVWGLMKNWLKEGQIPDEAEFEADLTGPEYSMTAKNTIQLERKEDMEKRGVASPDNGDALAMSFAAFPAGETREERVEKEQAAITDPMALHFARLAETERRIKAQQPKHYWD